MFKLLIFIFIIIQISAAYCQPINFEKLWKNITKLYSVQQTSDDKYILSGSGTFQGDPAYFLIKTTDLGDTLWTKRFSLTYDHTHAQETKDGGFILAGTTNKYGNNGIMLIKTDSNGDTLWTNVFGGQDDEQAWNVIQTFDNGFIINGYRSSEKLIIKTDSIGNFQWEHPLPYIGFLTKNTNIYQTVDSSYVIPHGTKLTKLSKAGVTLWTKSFNQKINFVRETADSKLIILGRNVLIKTDSTGTELWRKIIVLYKPVGCDITTDGGYILAGEDKLLKTDASGNEEWSKTLDGTAHSLCLASDGGYIIAGEYYWTYDRKYGWIVKTDSSGFYRSLILLFPEEGEILARNFHYRILWKWKNAGNIKIDFSNDNGANWSIINPSLPADSGSFSWITPGLMYPECKIRLTDLDFGLISENEEPFAIIRNNNDSIVVNEIKMWFDNGGNGSHDPNTDGSGLYWPGGESATKTAVFQDGLVWGGKVNGEIRFNGNTHQQGLQPGSILDNGFPANPDSAVFGVWKIQKDWQQLPAGNARDRLEYDYNNWPVDLGAPWEDTDGNGVYTPGIDLPKIYGDETNWMVMNDLDSSRVLFTYGSYPLALEVQLTIYAYNTNDGLKDVVIKKYRLINKGSNNIDDMILGYWSDADLGDASDDCSGCDTVLSLGYTYNGDNFDGTGTGQHYGLNPPAVGYCILQGPIIPASMGDSAYFNGQWRNGFQNAEMTAFALYRFGFSQLRDPNDAIEFYNNLSGLAWNGNPFINPLTGLDTKFVVPGDPALGSSGGWHQLNWPSGPQPGDVRFLLSSGQFTLAPGDTQEIVIAIILAQGNDYLDSVTKLKQKTGAVYDFYYSGVFNFVKQFADNMPMKFELEQNYPNPFNPKTSIKYSIARAGKVELIVYDILGKKVVELINENKKAGDYEVIFDGSKYASGLYFYKLKSGDFIQTRKMLLIK